MLSNVHVHAKCDMEAADEANVSTDGPRTEMVRRLYPDVPAKEEVQVYNGTRLETVRVKH